MCSKPTTCFVLVIVLALIGLRVYMTSHHKEMLEQKEGVKAEQVHEQEKAKKG